MIDNAFTVLNKKIREHITARTEHVAGGGCKDFAAYQRAAGVIEGLKQAESELLDLNKQIEEEDF